jgi:hypothetical protein
LLRCFIGYPLVGTEQDTQPKIDAFDLHWLGSRSPRRLRNRCRRETPCWWRECPLIVANSGRATHNPAKQLVVCQKPSTDTANFAFFRDRTLCPHRPFYSKKVLKFERSLCLSGVYADAWRTANVGPTWRER